MRNTRRSAPAEHCILRRQPPWPPANCAHLRRSRSAPVPRSLPHPLGDRKFRSLDRLTKPAQLPQTPLSLRHRPRRRHPAERIQHRRTPSNGASSPVNWNSPRSRPIARMRGQFVASTHSSSPRRFEARRDRRPNEVRRDGIARECRPVDQQDPIAPSRKQHSRRRAGTNALRRRSHRTRPLRQIDFARLVPGECPAICWYSRCPAATSTPCPAFPRRRHT